MTDVNNAIDEARRAREEAEAAARRADTLEADAETARQRARDERIARQRDWAQRTVDAYDADIAEADKAVRQAQGDFEAAIGGDLATAMTRYLGWGEAAARHYALQVRIGTAAPLVGFEASVPEPIVLPPFSQALDNALSRRLAELFDRTRDETAAELQQVFPAEEGAPAGQNP